MIPKQEQVEVFSNSSNEKEFTINASAEAFRILSSGLYSNKIQAIIRELSCNAVDAHVMAGTPDRPFKIHLPDSWEPFFSIEDFGIGLDDEDVDNIYTSYFTSTKTSSNDLIGGLGLGSKTPFSYTDTFTIRTRKDGVERVYNAYVGKTGSPTVSMISEDDTDEPNGVLVTVPVRKEDFYNFRQEAIKVFQWFRVLPEINDVQLDNSKYQKLEEADGLLVDTQSYQKQRVTVVMGNVAYSVIPDEKNLPKTNKRAWMFLENAHLTVRYNIGDLNVTASRESISFDDDTIKTFVDRIENFAQDYYDGFQKKINDNCTTKKEAILLAEKELGVFGLHILEFKGENLYEISEANVMEAFGVIIKDKDSPVQDIFEYQDRGGFSIRKTYFDYVPHWKFRSAMNVRIAIMQDDTLHHRGLDRAARQLLRDKGYKRVYTTNCVLSDAEKKTIIDSFEEAQVDFFGFEAVRESQKEVRQKEVKERGPRKTPVARAKKNEIRIEIWENNKVFTEEQAKNETWTTGNRELVDIDAIADKRVGFLVTDRNNLADSVLDYQMDYNKRTLIFLTKLFDLDYIVISRVSEADKVRAKMPFLIEIKDLEKKHIKDNEFYFFAHLNKMGITDANHNGDDSLRQKLYNRSSFAGSGTYQERNMKRLALRMDFFDVGKWSFENTGFENLARKYQEVLNNTFTDFEKQWVLSGNFDFKYEYRIKTFIESEIEKDAELYYQVRQNAMDRFPLLAHLMESIYHEECMLQEHAQEYIDQLLRLEELEEKVKKELYDLAA